MVEAKLGMKKFYAMFSAIFALNLFDGLTTMAGLGYGNAESNPLVNVANLSGSFIVKMGLVTFLGVMGLITLLVSKRYLIDHDINIARKVITAVFMVIIGFYIVVVSNNIAVLILSGT